MVSSAIQKFWSFKLSSCNAEMWQSGSFIYCNKPCFPWKDKTNRSGLSLYQTQDEGRDYSAYLCAYKNTYCWCFYQNNICFWASQPSLQVGGLQYFLTSQLEGECWRERELVRELVMRYASWALLVRKSVMRRWSFSCFSFPVLVMYIRLYSWWMETGEYIRASGRGERSSWCTSFWILF